MLFRRVLVLSLILIPIIASSQAVNMGVEGEDDNGYDSQANRSITQCISKDRVRVLTIGIGKFSDTHFGELKSYSMLNDYKKITKDCLGLSYREHPKPVLLNGPSISAADVRKELSSYASLATASDLIIISILSHGVVENDEYYLVCSDTNSEDYAKTAVSGKEIRTYLEQMAEIGAIVIVFIDTCHAAALFEKSNYSPQSHGAIAYYASSKSDQAAKEIYQKCKFTDTILRILQYENKEACDETGFVTMGSLEAHIKAGLQSISTQYKQDPVTKYFSNYDDDNFRLYPIIMPPPKIWPNAFSPIAVSPNNGRGWDYALIGVEGVSLLGMVVTGPVLQPYFKAKIRDEEDVVMRNEYREKGKNAAIGFCVSTGMLVSSYLIRALHVNKQMTVDFKEQRTALLEIQPVFSSNYNGLALVLNF